MSQEGTLHPSSLCRWTFSPAKPLVLLSARKPGAMPLRLSDLNLSSRRRFWRIRTSNPSRTPISLHRGYAQLMSRKAADVIAAEFRKAYSELNNSEVRQSREFIEAQLLTTRKAMVKAQDALKKFQEENEVVDLAQQNMAAVQRMAQAKTNLNQAEAAYQAARARVTKQESELKKLKPMEVASISTALNPEWQQLRQQIILNPKAGCWRVSKSGKLPWTNHPDVQNVRGRLMT